MPDFIPSASAPTPPENSPSIFEDVYDLEPYEKTMRTARIWLYVIASLQLVMSIYEYNTAERSIRTMAAMIDVAISAVFFGMAIWSKTKPKVAFICALSFYAVIIIGLCILNPANIYKGIILKILAIIALVRAINDAGKYEEAKRNMSGM